MIPKSLYKLYWSFVVLNAKRKFDKKFKGNNVCCTICGSNYKIFDTVGKPPRTNARCLECNSLERHRLLNEYLKTKTDLFNEEGAKLLHFAPEKTFYNLFKDLDNIEYYPCDLDAERFKFQNGKKIIKADIRDIPFKSDSFDAVICNHVLEHIDDDVKAINEVYRVLKKGGWAILQVPIDMSLEKTYEDFSITSNEGREKAFGQFDHVRIYGKDYAERLKVGGFNVIEDNYIDTFSDAEIFRLGLTKGEIIFFCKKE